MTVDEFVRISEALAKRLGVSLWPIVVAILLLRFAPTLKEFLHGVGEFSFKAVGFEATARKEQARASAALVAASLSRTGQETSPESAAHQAQEAAAVVADSVTARVLRRAGKATLLWVDDRPANSVNERQSLEALGVSIVLATSTEQALQRASRQRFDVIISDMGRPPDPQAGYTLLDRLRQSGDQTPYVIYASSNAPEHRAEARRRGAIGATNRAIELFEYVLTALNRAR